MIHDATLPLSPALARWPGDPPVEVERFGDEDVVISRWTLGTHAGTHVDAPAHFGLGATVDELDPALLLGPCRVLDCTGLPLVTAEDLAQHDLAEVQRLLLKTDNSARWQQDAAVFHRDFVAMELNAAQHLLDAGIRLLGVDGLSVEPYSGDGAVHHRLLAAGIIIIEGVNLAGVPAGDYHLICAPLRLQDADGAPARVWLVAP
jgi:arylformamidase